ncbi:hypothetical protein [Cetobacterium sp.]|uniref:hypothetical protein n=1 Tax=Cetobacterium sp. TaxID=2071632 RepID=UPI003FA5C7EE
MKEYYENGNLKNEGNFFKGYYEGIYKEYSDTGKLMRKAIYRDKEMTNIENY